MDYLAPFRRLAPIFGIFTFVASAFAGPPFEQWRAQHFTAEQLANLGVSGPNADPDQDGRSNLLEYALGTDPWVADGPASGSYGADLPGTGHLTLSYPRQKAADDLVYWVYVAGSLEPEAPWQTGYDLVGFAGHLDTGTVDWVKIEDQAPSATASRRLLTLRVTLQAVADADGNGLPDWWEAQHFAQTALDPNWLSPAKVPLWQCYAEGRNPRAGATSGNTSNSSLTLTVLTPGF